MLTNKRHINKSNSDFVIIYKAIKKAFLFKLFKKLLLLLYLASSKNILLSLNSLVYYKRFINVSFIKRQI